MKIMNYQTNKIVAYSIIVSVLSLGIIMLLYAENSGNARSKQAISIFPPKNVMSAVKKDCPTCDVVTINDLAEEAKAEFHDMFPHANPGWITGDFNGDGLTDYALLLTNKDKGKSYLRLVSLLASVDNNFTVINLIKPYEGDSFWYIGIMPSGTVVKHTRAFAPQKNEPHEIKLKIPAIEYFKAGSSMSVFYFEKGLFHMIPVSY